MLLALTHGLLSTGISVFDKAILADLHVSRAALKLRDVVQLVGGGLWALAIGFVADRVGPRSVIYAGLAVLSAALFAYGHVTDVRQIYALHVALAFAYTSCHVVVVLLILTRWFTTRRAAALGLILAGESLGGTILPPGIAALIAAHGWRGAMELLAIAPLGLAAMLALLLRGRPEDHGQLPLGGTALTAAMPMDAARFRARTLWLILAIAAALFTTGGGIAAHSFLYFTDLGFSSMRAASCLSLVFLGAFIGKSSAGFLAERIPRIWLAYQAAMLAGTLCLTLALTLAGGPLIWPGIALFGLGWGGSYTLIQANVMERFRGPFLGRLSGLIVLVEGLFAGIGSYAAGLLHDADGSYMRAYALMTCSVVLALAGTLVLQKRR